MSGIHAAGYSDQLIYDDCNFVQNVIENINHSQYRFYQGAFENKNKCKYDNFYHPYDLVDVESELRNQTRPASKCPQVKYRGIEQTGKCATSIKPYKIDTATGKVVLGPEIKQTNCSINGTLGTLTKATPVVYPPEICPIVYNNIPKRTCPGFVMPEYIDCDKY